MAGFTEKVKKVANDVKEKFTKHPEERGEGYFKHFGNSMWAGMKSMVHGCKYMIHGCFPFVFKDVDQVEETAGEN